MKKDPVNAINADDYEKYENPIPSRDYIIDLLTQKQQALTLHQLIEVLELDNDDTKEALRRRLRAMDRDGQLSFRKDKGYSPIPADDLMEGRIIGHRDGFGFLKVEGREQDIYLHFKQMSSVFDGDTVLAVSTGINRRGREEARIIKVLKQKTKHLVGRIELKDDIAVLIPENPTITHTIHIGLDKLNGAQDGQHVNAEIIHYPNYRNSAKAEVVEVLGDAMAPGMEIDLAIRSHDIPHNWPEQVLADASLLGDEVKAKDKLSRIDLTNKAFVTIDGEDARDFDDAVYVEKQDDGHWRLFVAIADVSHYITPNTPLDEEAKVRATSVYFPGHVVPMLPEAISNGLCSLNPKVDRLVMVCEMLINTQGKLVDYQFYESVIHSHARLTYTQVGAMLEEPESELGMSMLEEHKNIVTDIYELHQLYMALRKERISRGAIEFEAPESQFLFNEQRKINKIVPVVRNDAHKLIEECMLCANEATARFVEKLKLPSLFRVHEGPKQKKLNNLRAFLAEMGLNLGGGEKPSPMDYDQLISSIQGRVDAHVIELVMLRSLTQAEYSPENQGHFGLAYPAYAHFTSPIRRYPDLLVHRAIRSVIRRSESGGAIRRLLKSITGKNTDPVRRVKTADKLDPKKSYPYTMSEMITLGEHCSLAGRRADAASWDVQAWLKCEYMQQHIGDIFSGIISTVTNFGLFISLDETQIEGLVHVSTLKGDHYIHDETKHRLIGENSRTVYRIGDQIKVKVVKIDLEQRKIEFELVK